MTTDDILREIEWVCRQNTSPMLRLCRIRELTDSALGQGTYGNDNTDVFHEHKPESNVFRNEKKGGDDGVKS